MSSENKNIYFSIIVCCYNSEKYIDETINSIISQSYKFWEIIIVNDGSSDNTENKIKKFIKTKTGTIEDNGFRFRRYLKMK